MKSRNLAYGGIAVALGIVILYVSLLLPINTFAILTIASCIIPIIIIKCNIKTAITVYIATSFLSFFILPINYFILYVSIFGIYGIIKFYIEKIRKLPVELTIKTLFFALILCIMVLLVKYTSIITINTKYSLWLLFIIGIFALLVYDYALTIIISFYINKFEHKK